MRKYIYLLVSLISLIVAGVYVGSSPLTTVPWNFDINGNAHIYGSKWAFFIFMFVPLIISIIYTIISKNQKQKYFEEIFTGLFIFIFVVLWYVLILCMKGESSLPTSLFSFSSCFLGAIIMFVSNFLPKIPKNKSTGLKIKATLNSEKVWKKTHRLGGKLGFIGGFIAVVCGIIGFAVNSLSVIIPIVGVVICLILTALVPSIYANILYSKER